MQIAWWAAGTLALSIIMTWLFIRGNANVAVSGLVPHACINLLGVFGLWTYSPPQVGGLALLAVALICADQNAWILGAN